MAHMGTLGHFKFQPVPSLWWTGIGHDARREQGQRFLSVLGRGSGWSSESVQGTRLLKARRRVLQGYSPLGFLIPKIPVDVGKKLINSVELLGSTNLLLF